MDRTVSGQPPDPWVSSRGSEGSPSPFPGCPYLSILSQLSDGFFTTAGRAGMGATLAPSVEQGSLRVQHSPSPNSGQGVSSISRCPPPTPQPRGHLGRQGQCCLSPPSLPAGCRVSPCT